MAHGLYCADEQRAGFDATASLSKRRKQNEILSFQALECGLNLNFAQYKREQILSLRLAP